MDVLAVNKGLVYPTALAFSSLLPGTLGTPPTQPARPEREEAA